MVWLVWERDWKTEHRREEQNNKYGIQPSRHGVCRCSEAAVYGKWMRINAPSSLPSQPAHNDAKAKTG